MKVSGVLFRPGVTEISGLGATVLERRLAFSLLALLGFNTCVLAQETGAPEADESCSLVQTEAEFEASQASQRVDYSEFCLSTVSGQDSVIVGRTVSENFLRSLGPPCPFHILDFGDAFVVCNRSWFQWRIEIARTVAGPELSGRIAVAHLQHSSLGRSGEQDRDLFVLQPISSARQRELLQADYYLVAWSGAHYCLDLDPASLGIETDYEFSEADSDGTCFSLRQ